MRAYDSVRIVALSDLHADIPENRRELSELSRNEYRDDVLVLAGDISHRFDVLRETLGQLRELFGAICYVPGNHELWSTNGDRRDALERFRAVIDLCRSLDVTVEAKCFGDDTASVRIVPLFSWYTRPEEGPDSLFRPKAGEGVLADMWADDHYVRWPPLATTPARHFLSLNDVGGASFEPTITFSHFLPRAELMFPIEGGYEGRIDPFNFSRVAGSTLLDEEIRRLNAQVHVYGHQHRDRCRRYDGRWYVSHCLGYPRERTAMGLPKRPKPIWADGVFVLSSADDETA